MASEEPEGGRPSRSGRAPVILPERQVRAHFDEANITIYQAYRREIATAACSAGTFVTPFKLGRMTWIKPSFLWMMYRSGWATKYGQEHILAVTITRAGFDRALAFASLSHFDATIHADESSWAAEIAARPVRVQWDPERDLDLAPLSWRSIQVGLGPEVVPDYIASWIVDIVDVTALAHKIRRARDAGGRVGAEGLLPSEAPYPVASATARRLGITESAVAG